MNEIKNGNRPEATTEHCGSGGHLKKAKFAILLSGTLPVTKKFAYIAVNRNGCSSFDLEQMLGQLHGHTIPRPANLRPHEIIADDRHVNLSHDGWSAVKMTDRRKKRGPTWSVASSTLAALRSVLDYDTACVIGTLWAGNLRDTRQ